ncbi:hypothetical protein [Paenibacillus rigui]|uniref:Probable sensor domain-containing protein n=1 Tax=Paenibacillus rigui TaxID=554312 RepID=A0A229UPV8_9BACL|nr:hypothetical protein [Paenibacillus rigui]OXM85255.1 hypothetical protein CF651_16805 [Paenibacillus rigui]
MLTADEPLEKIHEIIYRNLHDTLRLLNKRLHLKMYAVLYDENDSYRDTIRVRKTVSDSNQTGYNVNQESIEDFAHMFRELSIENKYEKDAAALRSGIKDLLNQEKGMYRSKTQEPDENEGAAGERETKDKGSAKSNDFTIFYASEVELRSIENAGFAIYVLEIRNLDEMSVGLFYRQPQFSFLRMLLDYFFIDYFKKNFQTKYNENHTQFARRMSRMFMGKLNNFLQDGCILAESGSFDNAINPAYYIHDLQEKIDDISTQTYEGSSPFGSIVFCQRNLITEKGQQRIQFAIKFIDEDKIKLEDAKRIRKLLELTDAKKELYLIADHQFVYGLGKVDWGKMKEHLTLRVEFRGLSHYELQLIRLDESYQKNGYVLFDGDNKIYQTQALLKADCLLAVSFKNPRLGEDGYSPQKLRNLLRSQFFDGKQSMDSDRAIDKLENIIRRPRSRNTGRWSSLQRKWWHAPS